MQINKIIGLLVLISMLAVVIAPAPALAAGRLGSFIGLGWGRVDEVNGLDALEASIETLENDARKMSFLYKNMDDAGIAAVKIVIVGNDGETLKTFYVVSHKGILDEGEVGDDILGDQNIPTFKMTVKEAEDGMKLLEGDEITLGKAINGARLYTRIEIDNMPPLDETIEELEWLDDYPRIKRVAGYLL